jgi:hypothetical protein
MRHVDTGEASTQNLDLMARVREHRVVELARDQTAGHTAFWPYRNRGGHEVHIIHSDPDVRQGETDELVYRAAIVLDPSEAFLLIVQDYTLLGHETDVRVMTATNSQHKHVV